MPDLNSVPPSPHFLANLSRRSSSQQTMPPPPVPNSPSLNILPSNQAMVNASSPSLPSPQLPSSGSLSGPSMGDNSGVGPGPGPLRHPRPLTAADLHMQLEKEQEAVVNRLTRELSMLRAAQNASVVSNASSTSASASGTEPAQWVDTPTSGLVLGHYQPIRHHRTSSSASARSITATAGSVSTTSMAGISSPAPVRPSQPIPAAAGTSAGGIPLSRQNSSASRRSRTGSPAPATITSTPGSSYTHPSPYIHEPPSSHPGFFSARMPMRSMSQQSQSGSTVGVANTPGTTATTTTTTATSELSPGILPATSRYEETASRRAELEEIKRENEALRRRVRELEKLVRDAALREEQGRRGQQGERGGEGLQRTASSTSNLTLGVGVPEEELRLGESAASAGLVRVGGGDERKEQ
ncbi:hypothetical protein MMYC01_209242 [Madurella mycetomatis]|uniref:Uncharacterized protein n=1 Tax=Madurella mycetomatis TaxID=100816 RepID=A0A175VQ16_9PEZI|nr:hypothetical protein MMYC01_209242 [Madurella mycetomatis]